MERAKNGRWNGKRIEALAERVNDYFGAVLMLVVATYVMASLLPNRGWTGVLISLTASTTAVFALSASNAKPIWIRRAIGLAILAIALMVIAAITGAKPPRSTSSLITVLLLTVSMARVLVTVVRAPRISVRTILGAISVYTALGLLFAFLYGAIADIQGGDFFQGFPNPIGSDFVFFSYTTLTTVGYGNLVPSGQPGEMTAGLEMLIGQIFLVTLVAGLVSGWRPGEGARERARRRGEAPGRDPAEP